MKFASPSHPDKAGRLSSETVVVQDLDSQIRQQMWTLFQTYYAQVSQEQFALDLLQKSHVILLWSSGTQRVLRGFSTIETYHQRVRGKKIVVFFSGDTVIEQAYWGQRALQLAWLAFAIGLKLGNPLTRVYWLLITKGYKTYLLLSRNFPEYWPRYDRPTPDFQKAIIHELALKKFGDDWNPDSGLMIPSGCSDKLKASVAPICDEMLIHPDIRFFVKKNPGHELGHELVCIGRINAVLALSYIGKTVVNSFRSQRKNKTR